jgi:hypothetical protein
MCRLSRNPGALTSRTPQVHVDLIYKCDGIFDDPVCSFVHEDLSAET